MINLFLYLPLCLPLVRGSDITGHPDGAIGLKGKTAT